MQIISPQETPSINKKPVVLSIGNFDGVHLGHQAVLKRVTQLAHQLDTLSAVITFENHPSEILRPEKKTCFLSSMAHRQKLIAEATIDLLILKQFTQEFSQQTPEDFLQSIYNALPFSHLILGYDAAIGKDRQGDKKHLLEIADRLKFSVEYIDQVFVNQTPVSSTNIRALITQGHLQEAQLLLGRQFSIVGTVIPGKSLGKKMGYPTANISVEGLCLPPLGVYAVTVRHGSHLLHGAANLGLAPTVRNDLSPLLEVCLLTADCDLYDTTLEVIFEHYLRPEKRFSSTEELKTQIGLDLKQARIFFQKEIH